MMARCLGHHGMYVTALRIHGLAILFDDKVPWTSWSNLWLLFLPCRGGGGASPSIFVATGPVALALCCPVGWPGDLDIMVCMLPPWEFMVLLFALMARCLGHEGLIGPYTGRGLWALWPYGPCSLAGEEPWTIAAPSDGRDPWTSWYHRALYL